MEVDASKELVRTVAMNLPTRKLRVQPVEYEHEPKFCANCKMFGHTTATCNLKEQAAKQNQDTGTKLSKLRLENWAEC